MAKKSFHYNPKTGKTGICTAVHNCQFGGDMKHFSTEAEASAEFELTQSSGVEAFTPEYPIYDNIKFYMDAYEKNWESLQSKFKKSIADEDNLSEDDENVLNASTLEGFKAAVIAKAENDCDDETKKKWFKEFRLINDEFTLAEDNYKAVEADLKQLEKDYADGAASKEQVLNAFEAFKKESIDLRNVYYDQELAFRRGKELGVVPNDGGDILTRAARRNNVASRKTLKRGVNFEDARRSPEMYRSLISELTAWSGLSRDEVKEKLRAYDKDSGMTRDEYVVSLFQNNMDTTRARVFVDIETSGLHPTCGEIIEMGIVRMSPDGTTETVNERYDFINSELRKTLGTGPVSVHKIESEDLEGKDPITKPEIQAVLNKHLNDPNAIIVCHNKVFEDTWFNHEVDGYYESRNFPGDKNPPRIQDTRALAMFLGHSLPNTKLESFSQGNGVPYVDAHTAIVDAEMTADAFVNFQKKMKESPQGVRPDLSF